jgi:hypothetical protein
VDDPDHRPVLFNPYTGQRLQPGEEVSLDEYDIQDDNQYCIWCGTIQYRHYTSWSQWIPCREVLGQSSRHSRTALVKPPREQKDVTTRRSEITKNGVVVHYGRTLSEILGMDPETEALALPINRQREED